MRAPHCIASDHRDGAQAVFGEDLHSGAALTRQRRLLKTAVARLIGGAPVSRRRSGHRLLPV
jgi:hypothetical protein